MSAVEIAFLELLADMKSAGITPRQVHFGTLALFNATLPAPPVEGDALALVVDIGATSTGVVLCGERRLLACRQLAFGGDAFTEALATAQAMARAVTDNLGGAGLFGVEFFLCGAPGQEEVVFSELSPRPHDTGLVTLVGQNLSEFELHLRAVLGLPIPAIEALGPAASRVILAQEHGTTVQYEGLEQALATPDTQVLLFGKPEARPQRRLGVALARGADLAQARQRADAAAAAVRVRVSP